MCPPSLGGKRAHSEDPQLVQTHGFYPSWCCYHSPKFAMYVCVCLTSLPGVAPL